MPDQQVLVDPTIEQINIVVISESNNPQILNPDFLKNNEIVPNDWVPSSVIVTQPLSQIVFSNGVSVTVEEQRLQVKTDSPNDIEWREVIPTIVIKYLEVLQHVHYNAVGINMVFARPANDDTDLKKMLVRDMIVEGPWNSLGDGLSEAIVELKYTNSQPYLGIKVQIAIKKLDETKTESAFLYTTNLHNDFNSDETSERRDFIASLGDRVDRVLSQISDLH